MNSPIARRIYLVMLVAFLALAINAAIPINALRLLDTSYDETTDARHTISLLDNVLLSLIDAQTGLRGYVITGNPNFLEPYYSGISRIDDQLQHLQALARQRKSVAHDYNELAKKCAYTLEMFQTELAERQSQGAEAAMEVIATGEGKRRTDAVRLLVSELRGLETSKLERLKFENRKISLYTTAGLVGVTIADLVLFMVAFFMLYRALMASRETESELASLHEESMRQSEILKTQNRQKSIQARLADVLQTVLTTEEAYTAIQKNCERLFPSHPGMFYVRSNSKDYFEPKASWNGGIGNEGFEPKECWAARSNRICRFNIQEDKLPCPHIMKADHQMSYAICLPISSADEMIGIMVLGGPLDAEGKQLPVEEEVENLAAEVVNQIGLAITNLRLRDSLRKSSILDALTGLFNRRYLDETIEREFARAAREDHSLGVIMLDIDHFKALNDNYGHETGDYVLRQLGPLLRSACRTSDIACRFGGEEFILILPDADVSITTERAEMIRKETKMLRLTYGGAVLPTITVSLGVATFPDHGMRPEEIIRAADGALYRAKKAGRDRVEVADGTPSEAD